jgi:hypothetical protein
MAEISTLDFAVSYLQQVLQMIRERKMQRTEMSVSGT